MAMLKKKEMNSVSTIPEKEEIEKNSPKLEDKKVASSENQSQNVAKSELSLIMDKLNKQQSLIEQLMKKQNEENKRKEKYDLHEINERRQQVRMKSREDAEQHASESSEEGSKSPSPKKASEVTVKPEQNQRRKRKRLSLAAKKRNKQHKTFQFVQKFGLGTVYDKKLRVRPRSNPMLTYEIKICHVTSHKNLDDTSLNDLQFHYVIETDRKGYFPVKLNSISDVNSIIAANNRNEFPIIEMNSIPHKGT